MDFLERLSCLLGKQYLFLETTQPHHKVFYYNRWISARQTKEEAEEWLLKTLREYFDDNVEEM